MYSVYSKYKGNTILIHSNVSSSLLPHLITGSVIQGINTADSFSFDILPDNPGFNFLTQYSTEISVINNKNNKEIFDGRVLDIKDSMNDDGTILKSVVCESSLGYLQDSIQPYLNPRNWTKRELLTFILNNHNSQVEEQKKIHLGDVTIPGIDENIYIGLQRQTTFDAIKEKLLDKMGGEIRIRKVEGIRYLDYAEKFGSFVQTSIKLKVNMKNLSKEDELNTIITRLYPYGAKITDEDDVQDVDNDNRVDITSVNNGIPYIEDKDAMEVYGIIEGTNNWDDVTVPKNLLTKATEYLNENNRIKRKYSINSIDLSLINQNYDEINVFNYYPVENKYLNVNENLRVIKKTTNIINPTEFSIELGDSTKTILDLQLEERNKYRDLSDAVINIESDYVTNDKLNETKREINNSITQVEDNIKLTVEENYVSKSGFEEFKEENEANINVKTDSILEEVSKNELLIEELSDGTNKSFQQLSESVSALTTANERRIEVVEKTLKDGVETLKNRSVVIDGEGMTIATNMSKIEALFSNDRIVIQDNLGNNLLFVGYDEQEGRSKAEMDNLWVRNYFIAAVHRLEEYEDPETKEARSGFFYMGGGN